MGLRPLWRELICIGMQKVTWIIHTFPATAHHLTKELVSGKRFQGCKHNNLQSALHWCATCHSLVIYDNLTCTLTYCGFHSNNNTASHIPTAPIAFVCLLQIADLLITVARWKRALHTELKWKVLLVMPSCLTDHSWQLVCNQTLCTYMYVYDEGMWHRLSCTLYCSRELFPIPCM